MIFVGNFILYEEEKTLNRSAAALEFHKILDMLCELAMSENAKQKLAELRPYLSECECRRRMQETTDARSILESSGTPPLASMKELDKILELCSKGSMLVPEQLVTIAQFLASCKRMKAYLKKAESMGGGVALYGASIDDLSALYDEIDRSIRNETVADWASPALRDIRRKMENVSIQVKAKLDSLLRSKKEWFMESYVSTRNGHFVLPVKKEFKNQVSGTVVDMSGSGGTYFIEPSSVRKLQEELAALQIEEENEVRKILYTLTSLVEEQMLQIRVNIEAMESLDFVFAKAGLSEQMKAIPVPVTTERKVIIRSGRHPLLKQDSCVPLDFEIGGDITGVVITGPNTGGKTVALKTVGLLSMMAQSGLHVPVAEGSEFCMHNLILCDIGDGQSIMENLSTFSSHIRNIIEILRLANHESLVLLDELGSGTDPAEGMGIAVSVLEELKRKNCLFVATTHYPEVKDYAGKAEKLANARMAFDRESLRPLYSLEMGEAGESCALYIAQRLGFPPRLLETARNAAYGQTFKKTKPDAPDEFAGDFSQHEGTTNPMPEIQKEKPKPSDAQKRCNRFNIGDSVLVYPKRQTGIVYRTANDRGEIGVQIKGKKLMIPHKRLKLQVPASELYPPDYDFSIIFDTVANRKARRVMEKRHDPNVMIKYEKEGETR